MVLELRIPHGIDWEALRPLVPVFLTYVLSFIFLGIYWNNRHHLLYATERINGKILLSAGSATSREMVVHNAMPDPRRATSKARYHAETFSALLPPADLCADFG
jgi:hypothetical protein